MRGNHPNGKSSQGSDEVDPIDGGSLDHTISDSDLSSLANGRGRQASQPGHDATFGTGEKDPMLLLQE